MHDKAVAGNDVQQLRDKIWTLHFETRYLADVSTSESGFRVGKTVTKNLKCHKSPVFLIFSLYLSLIYIVSAHKFTPETPPSDSLIQFESNL